MVYLIFKSYINPVWGIIDTCFDCKDMEQAEKVKNNVLYYNTHIKYLRVRKSYPKYDIHHEHPTI